MTSTGCEYAEIYDEKITTKVYTLNITREEEIIGLSALSISGLELSPKFDSEKYSYTVKLTEDLDKLQIQTTPTIKNIVCIIT